MRYGGVDLALDHCLLLDRVRELVSDQFLSARALRLEFVFSKEDVFADSESVRAEALALLSSGGVSVDADVGEACAEPRLHVSTDSRG